MNNDDLNELSEINNNPEVEVLPEKQAQTETTIAKLKPKRAIALIIVLLLFSLGVAAYIVFKFSRESPQTRSDQNSHATVGEVTAGIPNYLFHNSQNIKGVSIGYLKATKTLSQGNIFFGRASAETPEYEPGIFYTNSGTTDAGGTTKQIFVLDTTTKASRQLTKMGGSIPVFSSVAQKLAYVSPAGVTIMDLVDNSDIVVQKNETPQGDELSAPQYIPSSWSPDGKRLAYFRISTKSSPELGLVSFAKLFIYDLTSRTVTPIDPPVDFNSADNNSGVAWRDNNEALVLYIKRGQFAQTLKEQLTKINVVTKASNRFETADKKIELNSIQQIGKKVFMIGREPRVLLSGPADGTGSLEPVNGSEGLMAFLLKSDPMGLEAMDIFMHSGPSIGHDNETFDFFRLPASGGQKVRVYSPEGYFIQMLGWGKDFDEIIYLATLSGKSEIQQYTISQNKKEVLVANLPLGQ